MTEPLRDKDLVVLQAIQEGCDDVQKITEATTLENHEVNYCFTKLQDLDLIQVEKQDGYTTRIINGQKHTFKTPKQAELTQKATEHLEQSNQQDLEEYENLTHRELVEKVHRLEKQVEDLEGTIQKFRKQVRQHLLK
ncbi:hypothetical protein Harman_42070 [Haloarcula mannanilytica]|uniref:Uncharacterized protein n=1 Tax=Haloarcula mannanilytica TaxID=2509225 RepID=A0A4C2EPS7_9EURY|nr:hypothetical protein [Haloarcula mannanilytica]GCF16272.1 hypothetical protein Harman_42070 [Haloarcula mannanilytica]